MKEISFLLCVLQLYYCVKIKLKHLNYKVVYVVVLLRQHVPML